MSSTQFLIDGASRHAVFVQRYAGGLENQYSDELANALERVIDAILNYDDSSPILLNTLRADIGRQLSSDIGVIGDDLFGTLIEFADSEGEFSAELFQQGISADVVPTPSMIAPLRNTLMNVEAGGITISGALSAFSAAKVTQVDNIISDGFLNGQTSQQVAQSLRDVVPLPRNQMRSLVRTATNAASSMARTETMRANRDIFTGYEWVATLDSHTSFICMGRDGNIYEIGEGPLPPAHWGACVGGTMIETKNGSVPIEDVKVGDLVMTHTGQWKPVTCVMAKPHKGIVKTLVDNFGHRVTLTKDHPILTKGGYFSCVDINVGEVVFNYTKKLSKFKRWVCGSLVKDAVLINSHNTETSATEELVAYTVTSFTAGMSSSVNLNTDITNNKVSNVGAYRNLKRVIYAKAVKLFLDNRFVKCWFRC